MTPPPTHAIPLTAPIPVAAKRPPWRHTFISLSVPNFRLFTVSNLIAMTAMWVQRIAQDWLVLELTGSPAAVGITVAMQFTPMLLFGLYGGVIADRYSKRALLMMTQSTVALLSTALAVLTLTGQVEAWHIYAIAFGVGLVTVIDNPTRQVFVNELVGPERLSNAISVNSSVFQIGRLVGPAISGAMIVAVGAGWAFGINAIACLVTVATLGLLSASRLYTSPPVPRAKGQLREGIRYIARKPTIFWSIVMLGFISVFAFNMPVLLTAFASDVYNVGAGGYGLFNSLVAIGALVGAFASTRRAGIRLRTVVLSAAAMGAFMVGGGLVPVEWMFGTLLLLVGFANLLFTTGANSLVQMSSNLAIRGRVMSVYVLVVLGGQALGAPLMGWVVEQFGAHTGMLMAGLIPTLAAAVIGVILARSARFRLPRRRDLVAIVIRRAS